MLVQKLLLYPDREDVSLTTYVQEDSPDLLNGKCRPAILICPGGGYFNCSDREAEPIALRFASMGYQAFVLRYSTYCEGGAFPNIAAELPEKKRDQHPAPVQDVGKAMRLICENAESWKVDTARIAVCGFSAGGHNAAMYATRWHLDPANPRPAAAILCYPLTDYVYKRDSDFKRDGHVRMFFRASDEAYLGTAAPSDELLHEVSPALQVSEHTPPCFLWATSADELVPVSHSLRMAEALAEANIPFELHIFEQGKHGMGLANQATAQAWSDCSADAAVWPELAEKWLQKRFALPLPEKSPFELMLESGGFPGKD